MDFTEIGDREAVRFTKLLGMLSSDFDGERANAARMATDLLRRNGITWDDLVRKLRQATPTPRQLPRQPADDSNWRHWGHWALECNDAAAPVRLLTEWEKDFLINNLNSGYGSLTPKQLTVYRRLVDKVHAYMRRKSAT